MSIEEQLKAQILSKYRSVNAFSKSIGIPNTTVVTILDKGIMRAGVQNVIRIFNALDLDVESIQSGILKSKSASIEGLESPKRRMSEYEKTYISDQLEMDEHLQRLINNYNQLNTEGKEKLVDHSEDLVASGRYIKVSEDKLLEKA